MVGELIRTRPARPIVPILLLAAALGLHASVGASRPRAALAALLTPPLAAVAAVLLRREQFAARFDADAIDVEEPRARRIEFARLHSVQTVPPALRSGSGQSAPARLILHDRDNAALSIPGKLTRPLADVVEFVGGRAGFGGRPPPDPRLTSALNEQVAAFGAERVFAYQCRTVRGVRSRAAYLWFSAAMLAAALGMTLISRFRPDMRDEYLLPASYVPVALVVGIIGLARHTRLPRKLEHSGVVIGPGGVSLVQGDVVGRLAWSELRGVRQGYFAPGGQSFHVGGGLPGLMLQVEGAEIAVADVYDRPLQFIERVIRIYWQGRVACPICQLALTPDTGPACPACQSRLSRAVLDMGS